MIKKLLLIPLSFWFLTSCKKEQPKIQPQTFLKEVITPDDIKTITPEEAKTYHKDLKHKYEYRTGTYGNYEYNYEVKGINQEGDSVKAIINIKGKYGAGKIVNKDKSSADIYVEWVDYGKLEGHDNEDNVYYLKAE